MRRWCCFVVTVSFVCSLLASCSEVTCWHNGIWYTDPQKCLDAEKADLDEILNRITPLDAPLLEKGLVILPDQSLLWSASAGWGRQQIYNIYFIYIYSELTSKVNTTYLTYYEMQFTAMAESIRKRGFFESIEIQQSDKPESFPAGDYDAIIYISSNLQQWFMKIQDQTKPEPIFIDWSKMQPEEKMMSWLDYIEEVLSKKKRERSSKQADDVKIRLSRKGLIKRIHPKIWS